MLDSLKEWMSLNPGRLRDIGRPRYGAYKIPYAPLALKVGEVQRTDASWYLLPLSRNKHDLAARRMTGVDSLEREVFSDSSRGSIHARQEISTARGILAWAVPGHIGSGLSSFRRLFDSPVLAGEPAVSNAGQ